MLPANPFQASDTAVALFHLVVMLIAIGGFAAIIARRLRKIGQSTTNDLPLLPLAAQLSSFIRNVALQKKLFRHPLRGAMHAVIFYAFLLFSIHTLSQIAAALFWPQLRRSGIDPYHFSLLQLLPSGAALHTIYLLLLTAASLLVLIALSYFAARRWIMRAHELDHTSRPSALILILIATLMTATVTETLSFRFNNNALGEFGWWIHLMSVYLFMLYVPASKHGHLLYAPIHFLTRRVGPPGALRPIDFEDESAIWGAGEALKLPRSSLLDTLACIECGRCTLACPASRTGKPLDPRQIITSIRDSLFANEADLERIGADEIWSCTSCIACVEECPVGNNPYRSIAEIRRFRVMDQGTMPEQLQSALIQLENAANPWGATSESRVEWCSDLNVDLASDLAARGESSEYLYWVGCAAAVDQRNREVARSMVKLFRAAGVSFSILGSEESCSGDTARRAGHDYLFSELARANIETLQRYNVKKIITACPHCYHTLCHDYRDFGGQFEVTHHSEWIADKLASGELRVKSGSSENEKLKSLYHDSCYSGRHNGIYEAPRQALRRAGVNVSEASEHHDRSMCCGAGGGQMWMEESGNRINGARLKHFTDNGAEHIATACPFCSTMLHDAVKADGESSAHIIVEDIAVVVARKIADT